MPHGTYGLPVHRLNTRNTHAWRLNPDARARMAEWLAHTYRTGVILCRDTMRVIAFVRPDASISAAKAPFRTLPKDIIANAPHPEECHCREWFDPLHEKWGYAKESKDEHHRYCEFHPQSKPAWLTLMHRMPDVLTTALEKIDTRNRKVEAEGAEESVLG